jgi:hypothetical protein
MTTGTVLPGTTEPQLGPQPRKRKHRVAWSLLSVSRRPCVIRNGAADETTTVNLNYRGAVFGSIGKPGKSGSQEVSATSN